MEHLQGIKTFTHTDEFNRLAGYLLDGKSSAASGVTFHLGKDDAGNLQVRIKLISYRDRILTGHGIGNKQHLGKRHRGADIAQFLHQRLINMQATGCINDYGVQIIEPGKIIGAKSNIDGLLIG